MTESIDRGESPYLQIARHYREKIERGELQPGQLLPSVRAMADRWQVAHTTTNRALRTLQADVGARGQYQEGGGAGPGLPGW